MDFYFVFNCSVIFIVKRHRIPEKNKISNFFSAIIAPSFWSPPNGPLLRRSTVSVRSGAIMWVQFRQTAGERYRAPLTVLYRVTLK
jgi:hypothetical protein